MRLVYSHIARVLPASFDTRDGGATEGRTSFVITRESYELGSVGPLYNTGFQHRIVRCGLSLCLLRDAARWNQLVQAPL